MDQNEIKLEHIENYLGAIRLSDIESDILDTVTKINCDLYFSGLEIRDDTDLYMETIVSIETVLDLFFFLFSKSSNQKKTSFRFHF